MNKKREDFCPPNYFSLYNNNVNENVKGQSQKKSKKVIKSGFSESASVYPVLSPTGVGVLTKDDHTGTEKPDFDIDTLKEILEERRCIQEVEASEIIPGGREKKRGVEGEKTCESKSESSPKENIIIDNITNDTNSENFIENENITFIEKITKDDFNGSLDDNLKYFRRELYEKVKKRNQYLYFPFGKIWNDYHYYIDKFHKEMGCPVGYIVFRGLYSEELRKAKVKVQKHEIDKKKNVYDSIRQWKKDAEQFERFLYKVQPDREKDGKLIKGKLISGNVFNMFVFTVPDWVVNRWREEGKNFLQEIRRLKKGIKYILNGDGKKDKNGKKRGIGIYNYVIVEHFWGDKDSSFENLDNNEVSMKFNLHFHILAKSNVRGYSVNTLERIRRQWSKILEYDGEVDIRYYYTMDVRKAEKYYNYIVRPFILDVFLYWIKTGKHIKNWRSLLNEFLPKNARRIEWYGRLRFKHKVKDEEFEEYKKKWKDIGEYELKGYEFNRVQGVMYAVFVKKKPADWIPDDLDTLKINLQTGFT